MADPVGAFIRLLAWLAIFLTGIFIIIIIVLWDGKIHKRGAWLDTGGNWYVMHDSFSER